MPAIVDEPVGSASDKGGGDDQAAMLDAGPNRKMNSVQSDMPIPINATTSSRGETSTSGGGAPRTTTSRRGGRTRARSPAVMGNRLSSSSVPGGGDPASAMPGGGDNPSSAAAAAAAAAKAFSSAGARNPNAWSEASRGEDPAAYGGYEKPYSGSQSSWPGETQGPGAHYSGQPAQRYPGGYGDDYPPGGGSHYRRSGDERQYHDRSRYRDARSQGYDDRNQPSSRRQPAPNGNYPPDYRYGQQGRESSGSQPKGTRGGGSSGGGGTSMVIGTSKPIHVPKKAEPSPSASERKPRGGSSAASVFRGRPESDRGTASAADADDDSPQKILLSLRTPTTSFEDKGSNSKDKKNSSGLQLSPDDPPQIQNTHQQSQDQMFEPTKSMDGGVKMEGIKNVGSIEMAASFNLFNQSFDSFGDGHYFNVDQNDSFGLVRTGSFEPGGADPPSGPQFLRTGSGGNSFSQQILNAGSGAMTIGYSPVNSFGTVAASMQPRRTGTMMVVGGPDRRAASPTQVLGMYGSYSAGGGSGPRHGGPLEDSHMRLSASVGSFGAQSMSYGRPYGEPGSSPYYNYPVDPSRSHESSSDRSPPFYSLLRKYKNAFKDCNFLLPGLKAALLEAPLSDSKGAEGSDAADQNANKGRSSWDTTIKNLPAFHGSRNMYGEPTPQDIVIARRRVECSVCAFGGAINSERSAQESKASDNASIFRGTDDSQNAPTVTPSSSIGSPPGGSSSSRARMKYEESLPNRYYENESRLSWEFEENPPVEISREDDPDKRSEKAGGSDSKEGGESHGDDASKQEDGTFCKPVDQKDFAGNRIAGASPQPKMRYRCKLCGQPKQNHNCPYQQSLARSIGVNVYPAVNAFAADEPGSIAPALSEMNNFVDQKELTSSNETSPNRPTPDRKRRGGGPMSKLSTSTTQVTPESMRSLPHGASPTSFATSPSRTPRKRNGMGSRRVRKRPYAQYAGQAGSDDAGDLLFVEAMELKPEQFRMVSQSKALKSPEAYTYPALPLPYAQRKRLSDNLFSLSNEVPKLTDECAQVLREAREKDQWDLAVAELMTQVVVIIHCPEGDHRFEGLRQYLLTLGISC